MTRAVNKPSHAAKTIEQTGETLTKTRPQAPASDAHGPHSADRQRLIEGAITPTLVRFAMPLLTTNLLNALSGTWGAIWVSHTLGPSALTAVVNANVFMFMMMGMVMGVGMAAGIAVGQSRGAGDLQAVKRVVGTSMSFVVVVSSLIAAAGCIFAPQILGMVKMPAASLDMAVTYLRFMSLSLPSIFCFIFIMMMMRGSGDARTPFRFTLVWIGLGLVLSPLLLTGAFGAPKLGIAGVAIGGLIANLTALSAMLVYIYRRNLPVALYGPDLGYLKPDPQLLLMLIRRGGPMALETLIIQGAYFMLLSLVNAHGAATAAAYSAAAQLWGYVQMPALALGASMSAMAAMNIGAGQWKRVEAIAIKGCLVGVSLTLFAAVIVYLLGDLPLRLFLPQGGEPLAMARSINGIVLWGWVVLAITSGMSAVVRANGATLAPTLIYAVTMWAFRIPFATALAPWLGSAAIWWSFPVGSVSSAILALAYYRYGGWRDYAPMMPINPQIDDTPQSAG